MLDPYSGSGTTCVAAERPGRQWRGLKCWVDAYEKLWIRLVFAGLAENTQILRQDFGATVDTGQLDSALKRSAVNL